MNEQLIDAIANEVMKRLQTLELSNQNRKKAMVVLSERSDPIPEAIRRDYQIIIPDSISSLNTSNINSMIDSAECILITSLSATQLANIALGSGDSGFLEGIRHGLLLGKTIFVLEEGLKYRSYRKSAHKSYYRRLLEYEECIEGYGIQILSQQMKVPISMNHNLNMDQELASRDDCITIDKKLLLEKDLMNLNVKSQTTVWIGKNTIVTPGALDYAKAHHIEIIKK